MDREKYGTFLPNELNRGGLGAAVRRAIQAARDQVDNSGFINVATHTVPTHIRPLAD